MLRRTPLSKISKKRRIKLAEYTVLRRLYLESNQTCHVCSQPATDIHHRKPRGRGGQLNDVNNFLAVCRKCHSKIHHNPKWAEENNLLIK